MAQLKKQIQLKEKILAANVEAMQSQWSKLKSDFQTQISAPHTLIWAGIGSFIFAELFHPSKRKLLLGFWPLWKKLGQPLWSKLSQLIQPGETDNEHTNTQ
ncbi:MAG: hypothetical protein K0S29_878 [Gammaproteobacteria bacterium]|jgi:hypothetical protein|nr:hypothetical protein [Gammaproteobacteria bacterium]